MIIQVTLNMAAMCQEVDKSIMLDTLGMREASIMAAALNICIRGMLEGAQ
jgi:hypothetical protein